LPWAAGRRRPFTATDNRELSPTNPAVLHPAALLVHLGNAFDASHHAIPLIEAQRFGVATESRREVAFLLPAVKRRTNGDAATVENVKL
jgi:hypothetical protein